MLQSMAESMASLQLLKRENDEDSLAELVESLSGRPKGLSLEGVKEWERLGGLCMEHLGEVIVMFCQDCSKSGCCSCCMNEHYQHNKTYMDIGGMGEGSFGQTGIFFPSEFTLEGLFKKLNEDLQDIDIRAADAKERIKACVAKHKTRLESTKKELVDHINAVKKAKLKYLQEQQKQLRKNLDWLISLMLFTNQHFDSDDPFSLLLAEKEITRRVVELNEKCCKISLPTEQEWNLDKIKVIRDGKYVWANQSQKRATSHTVQHPGMKTTHNATFSATSVKVGFEMAPGMLSEFVEVCCKELGEEYRLMVADKNT